ncbi:MAG: helix-turn-helix domain-containing protein [Nitrospirae bacterium]|nr:helix-turn-helix domain-containing protein [Nitrospirota bacterium]
MNKFLNHNYYEILEVKPDATYKEIEEAYRRAKETYSGESPATYSLFTAEECKEILNSIEMAYRTLSFSKSREEYDKRLATGFDVKDFNPYPDIKGYADEKPKPPVVEAKKGLYGDVGYQAGNIKEVKIETLEDVTPPSDTETFEGVEFNGKMLKLIRERKGMSLSFIAEKTRISIIYLEHIEADRYRRLPAEVYLKNYLMQYARAIGLDPKKVAESYMRFCKKGKNE